jgi:DNA-binding transcriptional ArsR family regulator
MRNQPVTRSPDAAFHALSDPTRRELLALLRSGGLLAAGQLAEAFPVSRPAISRHLRVLRKARLVQELRRGRHRLYQINPEPLRAVDQWLEDYRVYWQATLQGLKKYIEREAVDNSRTLKKRTLLPRRKRNGKD